jgi:hypothetical protein
MSFGDADWGQEKCANKINYIPPSPCSSSYGRLFQPVLYKIQKWTWSLKMGPISCPETSVRNYHCTLRNNSEKRSLPLPQGRSLKARMPTYNYFYRQLSGTATMTCASHIVVTPAKYPPVIEWRLNQEGSSHGLGFRREVVENCVLLGYYSASSGNSLPTFRVNLSFPSSRVKKPHPWAVFSME